MSSKENFISLSYGSVDYLIPKSDVFTAFICDSTNLVTDVDGKNEILFLSQKIPAYNLDDLIAYGSNPASNLKTCIVISTADHKADFNNDYFGVITSSECKVISNSLDSFSVFSDFYGNTLKQKGIMACVLNKENCHDNKIGYLLDVPLFIKMKLEIKK